MLLFGPLFWLARGVWKHAVLQLALGFITAGVLWLVYPFFTYSILRNHYLHKGWRPVVKGGAQPSAARADD